MNPAHFTAKAVDGAFRPFEPDPTLAGVSFLGTLRSEFAKLLALRTTLWLSLVSLLMCLLVSATVAFTFVAFDDAFPGPTDPEVFLAQTSVVGLYFAMLLLGSLGVVSMTTEFTTGAIRSSLVAVPKRTMLFVTKALALVLMVAAVALVLVLVSHILSAVITDELSLMAPFTNTDVLQLYVTNWVGVVVTSLLGFGLGALLRSSVGGIVILAIILFVLQVVLGIIWGVTQQADWAQTLMELDYTYFLAQFTSVSETAELSLWQSGLGVLVWVAVPTVLGWLTFTRRDA